MIKKSIFLIIATMFITQMSMGGHIIRYCGSDSAGIGISASVRGSASWLLNKKKGEDFDLNTEGTMNCELDGYHFSTWSCYLSSSQSYINGVKNGKWCCDDALVGCTPQWEKNTAADIKLYNGNSLVQTNSCTIDGKVGALPTPTKPGYVFKGWKTCATLISEINTSSNAGWGGGYNWTEVDGSKCRKYKGNPGADAYPCTETPNIRVGEWQAEFSYGTLYGESTCNTTPPAKDPWNGREYIKYDGNIKSSTTFAMNGSNAAITGDQKYCWCRITSFAPKNSASCRVSFSKWVFRGTHNDADACARGCPLDCGGNFYDRPGFRSTMVGAVKQ